MCLGRKEEEGEEEEEEEGEEEEVWERYYTPYLPFLFGSEFPGKFLHSQFNHSVCVVFLRPGNNIMAKCYHGD